MSYNGWSNYETWSVALIVDNDESTYHERRDLVRQYESGGAYGVANALKEWITDQCPDLIAALPGDPLAYLWSQLLTAALDSVDWKELADAWMREDV